MNHLRAILLLLVLLSSHALANDSEATLTGGNLILKKSKNIAMESEDLLITPSEVRVAYIFRNTGAKTVDTRIAFPIVIDIRGYEDQFEEIDTATAASEMEFELTVDGARLPVESTIRRRHGKLEITFHWRQVFPAGKQVAVSHRYTPLGAMVLPGPEYQKSYGENKSYWKNFFKRYCMDAKEADWMKQNGRVIGRVPYILMTGANWKGPIGTFRLTVRSTDGERVETCFEGLRREGERDLVMERKNYTPREDLDILFIASANGFENESD